MPRSQCVIHHIRQRADPQIQKSLQPGTDHIERQVENKQHDPQKTRDRRVFSRQYTIELSTADMLFTFFRFYDCTFADFFNKGKPHISDGCTSVESSFLFHLQNNMLQHLYFVLIKVHQPHHELISFDQF